MRSLDFKDYPLGGGWHTIKAQSDPRTFIAAVSMENSKTGEVANTRLDTGKCIFLDIEGTFDDNAIRALVCDMRNNHDTLENQIDLIKRYAEENNINIALKKILDG